MLHTDIKKLSIKEWSENDRPRERLLANGAGALSDAELIAILLSTGTREHSALDLAREILNKASNSLITLSKYTIADLTSIKGIGEAKAVTILTALELGRRRRESDVTERQRITSSRDVYEYIQSVLADKTYEEFWIVLLDRSNKILHRVCISEGGQAGTVADPKKIFKMALDQKAASIILCHNHPSGNKQPSSADEQLTKKLHKAGELLDIPVLDHIIVGEEDYFSFADEGMM